MEKNLEVYSSKKIVVYYDRYSSELQKPEKTIFSLLEPHLGRACMLDIGVGGGRTTAFFAPCVKKYTGIDFSAGMIEICRNKFSTATYSPVFEVCDVRDLSRFKNASFDIVLFSFNGLDNISYAEREKAILEIKRICSHDGFFCFSAHNLLSLPGFFKLKFRKHPIKLIRSLLLRNKLLKRNAAAIGRYPTADHVEIYDDVYDHGLYTTYVRPSFQVNELEKAGFRDIRVFELEHGTQTTDLQRTDTWLYYLCRV